MHPLERVVSTANESVLLIVGPSRREVIASVHLVVVDGHSCGQNVEALSDLIMHISAALHPGDVDEFDVSAWVEERSILFDRTFVLAHLGEATLRDVNHTIFVPLLNYRVQLLFFVRQRVVLTLCHPPLRHLELLFCLHAAPLLRCLQ